MGDRFQPIWLIGFTEIRNLTRRRELDSSGHRTRPFRTASRRGRNGADSRPAASGCLPRWRPRGGPSGCAPALTLPGPRRGAGRPRVDRKLLGPRAVPFPQLLLSLTSSAHPLTPRPSEPLPERPVWRSALADAGLRPWQPQPVLVRAPPCRSLLIRSSAAARSPLPDGRPLHLGCCRQAQCTPTTGYRILDAGRSVGRRRHTWGTDCGGLSALQRLDLGLTAAQSSPASRAPTRTP